MVTILRARRGGALMWSVGALALALALTPLYVTACRTLAALTGRGGHRLLAVNRGTAELERLRAGESRSGSFQVPELPGGFCDIRLATIGSGLRRAEVTVSWQEGARPARCTWTTLLPKGAGR